MKNLFFIIILFIFGCSIGNKIYFEEKEAEIHTFPKTIKIAENFYADETEVSNRNYRDFLYWLARLFGKESPEYIEALPDTLVWLQELTYGEPYMGCYLSHPAYNSFPVVGINLAQAKKYTNWRTERAIELYLINKHLIKPIENESLNNYFTINRYLGGGV